MQGELVNREIEMIFEVGPGDVAHQRLLAWLERQNTDIMSEADLIRVGQGLQNDLTKVDEVIQNFGKQLAEKPSIASSKIEDIREYATLQSRLETQVLKIKKSLTKVQKNKRNQDVARDPGIWEVTPSPTIEAEESDS